MIQAILFDMDGTLVDSVDLHAEAWQRAFAKFGREVTLNQARALIGKGADQFLSDYFGPEELARVEDDINEYRADIFRRDHLPEVRPFPGVRDLFERIVADGKRIALVSSSNQADLREYQKIAGIADLLDAATSADDAERSKPHPDIFHAALRRLGNPDPRTVVAIGDTPYDVIAAGKAGLPTVGVLCGGFGEVHLREAGCVALYADPADLLAHYDDSPLAG